MSMKELENHVQEVLEKVGATAIPGDKWGAYRMTSTQAKQYATEMHKLGRYKGDFPGTLNPDTVWVVAYQPAANFCPLLLEAEYRKLTTLPATESLSYWEMSGVYKWRDALKLSKESAFVRALTKEDALQNIVAALVYFKRTEPNNIAVATLEQALKDLRTKPLTPEQIRRIQSMQNAIDVI